MLHDPANDLSRTYRCVSILLGHAALRVGQHVHLLFPAGMRVRCANPAESLTQHQHYHRLSAAALNTGRNRNFVHRKASLAAAAPCSRAELGKTQHACFTMIHRDLEGRGGSRHYSRWPDPWRREDDWGPITAAVVFSLSWQDLSSTAAALTFRSLCIGALRVAPVRRKPRVGQAVVWRRSSLRVIRHRPRFRPLNFLDSVVRTSKWARIQLGGEARDRHIWP